MKNRIIILGSKGQLGTALCNLLVEENISFLSLDFPDIDITKPSTYENTIKQYEPNVIINCTAYTDVHKAESEVHKATKVNGLSLKYLAELCNRNNVYFVHISTDYVFSGNKGKPYTEEDKPDPVNIYGITKYFGEKMIELNTDNYAIVRTASLYGDSKLNSNNIIKKLISLAKHNDTVKLVKDEYSSPTYANDLAEQLLLITEKRLQGIIHATSEGKCNWVEFGKYLCDLINIDVKVEEVESEYFGSKPKKPKDCVLENKRLKNNTINIMLSWKDALKKYLESSYEI